MKLLLLIPLFLCSCASTRIEGGLSYSGQHGDYQLTYDGKTWRPVIILKDPKGHRK